jgi:hypothetical protein
MQFVQEYLMNVSFGYGVHAFKRLTLQSTVVARYSICLNIKEISVLFAELFTAFVSFSEKKNNDCFCK